MANVFVLQRRPNLVGGMTQPFRSFGVRADVNIRELSVATMQRFEKCKEARLASTCRHRVCNLRLLATYLQLISYVECADTKWFWQRCFPEWGPMEALSKRQKFITTSARCFWQKKWCLFSIELLSYFWRDTFLLLVPSIRLAQVFRAYRSCLAPFFHYFPR